MDITETNPHPTSTNDQSHTGHKANIIMFPIPKEKAPLVAEFENQLLMIEHLLTVAKSKNESLIFAFEQSAKIHKCPTSLALAKVIKETDHHLSLALRGMLIFGLPQDKEA